MVRATHTENEVGVGPSGTQNRSLVFAQGSRQSTPSTLRTLEPLLRGAPGPGSLAPGQRCALGLVTRTGLAAAVQQ